MYIGYYDYDGKTYFFGRASDGSTTGCSQNLNAIRASLQKIENETYPENEEYKALNAEPIQAFFRKGLDQNEKAVNLVDGFAILQMVGLEPEFSVFDARGDTEFPLVKTAGSLEDACYFVQQYVNARGFK